MNSDKRMNASDGNQPAHPSRKRLNHRGPLSIDVASAWYFITICAKDHAPWSMRDDLVGRDDPIAPHDQGVAFAVGRDEKRSHSIAVACDSVAVGRDDPIAPDELKKVLPTKAQLAKCVVEAERQVKTVSMGLERRQ